MKDSISQPLYALQKSLPYQKGGLSELANLNAQRNENDTENINEPKIETAKGSPQETRSDGTMFARVPKKFDSGGKKSQSVYTKEFDLAFWATDIFGWPIHTCRWWHDQSWYHCTARVGHQGCCCYCAVAKLDWILRPLRSWFGVYLNRRTLSPPFYSLL